MHLKRSVVKTLGMVDPRYAARCSGSFIRRIDYEVFLEINPRRPHSFRVFLERERNNQVGLSGNVPEVIVKASRTRVGPVHDVV
jgi:hypothetical protein